MKIKDANKFTSIFLLVASIFICIESYRLDIGTYNEPGPGFLPFWVGVSILILSLLLLLLSFKENQERERENILAEKRWKNILLVIASLFVYMVVLEKLGFIVSAFLFIVSLIGSIEPKKWYIVIIFAFASTLGAYLIFGIWLQSQLPKGIFG